MSNELLVIEKLELVPFFTKGDSVDKILEQIAKEARAHVPNVSTTKTRGEITANITKVTECKTYLEDERKKLADEYKLIPKKIDANGKRVKDFLTSLQKELRQPLTDWEIERKQAKDVALFLTEFDADLEAGYLEKENRDLKAAQAEADRQAELKAAADAATKKANDEAAEEIAQAGRDKVKAEQAAKDAEWLTYITEAYGINAKIDFDRQAAIAKENAAKQVKLNEWFEYIGEAYAYNDQLIATKNAQVAEAKRQQAIADQQKREQAKLEADKNHVASIKRDIMADFMSVGLDEAAARLATRALAAKKVRHTGINY